METRTHEDTAMPVTLESRARRMQIFHLPHDVFCRDRCACAEVAVVVVAENPRTGERAPKHLKKNVPGSITFLALERKPGLPNALLEVAEVKAAVGRGYLRIIEQTPDKAEPSVAAGHAPSHLPAPAASLPPQPPAPAANAPAHAAGPAQPPAPTTTAPHSPAPAANSSLHPPASATSASPPPAAAKPPGKEP
jgi:hypothetical protein